MGLGGDKRMRTRVKEERCKVARSSDERRQEEEEEEGKRVGCILLRKECRRALVFKKPDGDGMKQRIKTE